VRLAADILEPIMANTPGNPLRHALAHTQVIHPDDVQRIGALGLYLAYTYSWMAVTPPYDMTVIPFIEEVSSLEDLYDANSYYMQSVYPVRSTMDAGAVLIAGSDAPVDDLSPRPFINMSIGVSRTDPEFDRRALNADEAIDMHQMIAAYTINGARAMKQEYITGSIEVGKRADFAVLDRNIIDLYVTGQFTDLAFTKVDVTVFDGEVIYTRE
jgi:predicted amidohydrolase YtcJ